MICVGVGRRRREWGLRTSKSKEESKSRSGAGKDEEDDRYSMRLPHVLAKALGMGNGTEIFELLEQHGHAANIGLRELHRDWQHARLASQA